MGLLVVLFSDVELPESGGIVASAEETDGVTSTDEVVPALVDVEDKPVDEDKSGVFVGDTDVDVKAVGAAVLVLAISGSDMELALGAGDSPVESSSQVE